MASQLCAFASPLPLPCLSCVNHARLAHQFRRSSPLRVQSSTRPAQIQAVASDPQISSPPAHDAQSIIQSSFNSLDTNTTESAITSLEDVQELIELADECDLKDLRIVHNGVLVEITRPGGRGFDIDGRLKDPPRPLADSAPAFDDAEEIESMDEGAVFDEAEIAAQAPVANADESVQATPASPVDGAEEQDPNTVYDSDFVVTSDRVGFFFCGAKNKPPLVNVGDHVSFNQPVCIIEQLGQQYVYLSEASGNVVQVFVEDGDAVQYGTQIMVIRPD